LHLLVIITPKSLDLFYFSCNFTNESTKVNCTFNFQNNMTVNISITNHATSSDSKLLQILSEVRDLLGRFSIWLMYRNNFTEVGCEDMHHKLCLVFSGRVERETLGMFEIDGPIYLPLFFAKQATTTANIDVVIFPNDSTTSRKKHVSIAIALRRSVCSCDEGELLFRLQLTFQVRKSKIYLSSVIHFDTTRN